MPHHLEYEYPSTDVLFANGWAAGRTFLIDLAQPRHPRLVGEFSEAGGYTFPHAFARLPNDNVLATFQSRGSRYAPPGGLVELDPVGNVVRTASAATPAVPDSLIWPYSVIAVPSLGRAVTTSADMGMPPFSEWQYDETRHVQVWSLDSLTLVATVELPEAPTGVHHIAPAEPRLLADGTVYVNTFSCGLYRLIGLDSADPVAEFVHAFPGGTSSETECAVPVVYGRFWIQTVPALPGLIVLDVSDPGRPVEVTRLVLDERYPMPHWVGADRSSPRLVVTGSGASWVLIVDIDEASGVLKVDDEFRDRGGTIPGVDFNRASWPHGETGGAVVHGAVFSR